MKYLSIHVYAALLSLALFAVNAHASNTILVLGDSISAGYGVQPDTAWVAQLQDKLGDTARVINASVSGETTGGGLRRLPELLERNSPHILILELGGNDGLRGFPINIIHDNLKQIINLSHASDITVLLLGMRIPPNYGPRYTQAFFDIYSELAEHFELPLVGFFLEGIATDKNLMQSDGIHPNDAAQSLLLNNVLATLKPLLEKP